MKSLYHKLTDKYLIELLYFIPFSGDIFQRTIRIAAQWGLPQHQVQAPPSWTGLDNSLFNYYVQYIYNVITNNCNLLCVTHAMGIAVWKNFGLL